MIISGLLTIKLGFCFIWLTKAEFAPLFVCTMYLLKQYIIFCFSGGESFVICSTWWKLSSFVLSHYCRVRHTSLFNSLPLYFCGRKFKIRIIVIMKILNTVNFTRWFCNVAFQLHALFVFVQNCCNSSVCKTTDLLSRGKAYWFS